jgi:MATE family multidrug resistance protein
MDAPVPPSQPLRFPLPALRLDAQGRRHVDYRAIAALAAPLFANSSLQAVLSLTDTWFIGRLSTDATAAMGATYFLVFVAILLFGGVGMAVQTLAAQAYGGGRRVRGARAVWNGLWAALATVPPFVALAMAGNAILAPFSLAPGIESLAVDYWFPRLLGGPASVAMWSLSGFFNGIGRTRVTLFVMIVVAIVNAALNDILIFRFGLGIAGSAWATTVSLVVGCALLTGFFLAKDVRRDFKSALVWRPDARRIVRLFALGLPMGLAATIDLIGFSLFQLMTVKLGAVQGAATQVAIMLTSLAYMPAVGIGLAGTTLVGQSIGAGDRSWAAKVGNASILLAVGYMGTLGVLLALAGPWLMPVFVPESDPNAAAVVKLGVTLLWLAAAYQLFDGLNIGSSFCLRGTGDVRFPAAMVFVLSWVLFVPLAHSLAFAPGEGWVDFLPQFGFGIVGAWAAAIGYMVTLGTTLYLRWRSGAWRRIVLR